MYNVTSTGTSNTHQFGNYMADMYCCVNETVTENTVWYPYYTATSNLIIYKILDFIMHIIPGTIADLALTVSRKKMRLLPIYRQLTAVANTVSFAILKTHIFMCTNMSGVYTRSIKTLNMLNFFSLNYSLTL